MKSIYILLKRQTYPFSDQGLRRALRLSYTRPQTSPTKSLLDKLRRRLYTGGLRSKTRRRKPK